MQFMFDLEFDGLTDERGSSVVRECEARGGWPVELVPGRVEKRWFGVEKAYPTVLEIPEFGPGGHVLAPDAARDADAIALRPEATGPLATTVEVIADHFPDGFVFRATWAGSPIQIDEAVSVSELTALIRASRLNEFTRYTVPPHAEVGGG